MPRYEVNAPDGQRFEVDAPEGATLEDAFAYVQSNLYTPLDVQAKKKRTWGEAAADIGGSLTKGVGQLAQIPGQVAGLVTGGIDPTTGLQGVGQKIEAFGEELKSPTLKARQQLAGQKMAQAEGLLNEFGTAIKTYATDPMLATSFVAEQLPNLFGAGAGGLATKAAVKTAMMGASKEALEKTLPKAAVSGAVGTGAVMQGADIGTDTFDTVLKGLIAGGTPEAEAYQIALQKGRVAAIEAAGISAATAFLPGGTTIERALVGKGLPGVGGFVRGAAGEALSEGIEEGGGAFAKNIGVAEAIPGTSLTKGIGTAAGLGALGGALFGGPAGAITGMQEADRLGVIQAVKDQQQQIINAENEVAANAEQARRDAYAAEQFETEMRIQRERLGDQFLSSKAFADLSEQVEAAKAKAQVAANKVQAAQAKIDAGKAQLSAFAEAQPDLFGMVYPQVQQEIAAEQARVQQEQAQGQQELPLTTAEGQLGLPGIGIAQPAAGQPVVEVPTARPVTEADFKAMGVGPTNKKLREQILGKDLTDPAQAQEVKDVLENYAGGDRSEKIIKGVTSFLDQIQIPPEQLGLGLRRPYGSMKKPVPPTEAPVQEVLPNVEQPIEPIAGVDESSIPEPRVRRKATPPPAVAEVAGRGVVPTGGIAGLPTTREAPVPSALEPTAEEDFATQKKLIAKVNRAIKAERRAEDLSENSKEKIALRKAEAKYEAFEAEARPRADARIAKLTAGNEELRKTLDAKSKKAPVAGALNERQQAQFEEAAGDYLVAAKGKPEDTLRYVAADLYAKDNLTKAKRFFKGLSPEQQDVVNAEINRLKGVEKRWDVERERLDSIRDKEGALRAEFSEEDFNESVNYDPSPVEALNVQNGLEGKTAAQAAEWLAQNSPDVDQRFIAGRVATRIKTLEQAGLKFKFNIAHVGMVVPTALNRARGVTRSNYAKDKGTVEIWLNGAEDTGRIGTSYETALHELVHGATQGAIRLGRYVKSEGTELSKSVQKLMDVSNVIIRHFNARAANPESLTEFEKNILQQNNNALANEGEILTWALTNREMQQYLEGIFYKGTDQTVWSKLVDAVRSFLNLPASKDTALSEVLHVADEILSSSLLEMTDIAGATDTSLQVQGIPSLEDIDKRAGYSNVKPDPKQGMFKTLKGTDKKQIESGVKNFLNKAETMYFSSDAALQNAIRKGMEESGMNWEDQKRMMFMNTTSQALHPDAVAMQLLQEGGVEYEKDTYKWKAVKKDASWQSLVKDISAIAKQYNVSTEQMSNYAHRAFIADRLKGLTGSKEEFFSHKTPAQIEAGLEYFKAIPELRGLQTKWNEVRKNAMDAAVVGGLYSESQAKELLDIMDYVPFFRMEQLEAKAGPKEYGRGLLDFAKGYKIRGSEDEVNNIFDNMERWVSYTVSRAVKNRTALNLYDAAKTYLPEGEVTDLRQDERVKREQNTIDLWENGQRKKVEFKDPLFIYAFQGNEPVTMPVLKAMSAVSNILRKNIVLNPLFSISQLSQDSVGAMFTSGLKNPFAIPFQVAKEFTNTLRGKSAAHAELAKYGAVGVRDYSAAIARNDAEIVAGLASPTKFQKFLSPFEKFAMASDNAVRQAVYNLTLKETGDKAAAIEKAFEIINFKRSGASGSVQVLKQVVPFFGAYLQAQNVAYKTIMGKSISPAQKKEAHRVLMSTTAKIAALGFIYAALCADDEDYQKMDPTIRDRHLLIPGTGFMLPIRPDIFILPKLAAEYSYQIITDQGFTDGKKLRRGMSDAIMNAILSPTVVPQVAKPALEVMTNYNFFTGRPLVGMGLENKITAEQFTNTTSELAKFLGKAGLVAPVNIDHLIKGYLGTTGGLMLQATSSAANIGNPVPTPEKSLQDTLASTPGLSTFFIRENGAAMKNDYYELRGEVDKAVATYNNMIKTGRVEEAKEFYQDKKELFTVKQQVNTIERQLTKLRDRSKQIYASTKMSSEEKGAELERIKEIENRMLANINDLRKRAGF